MLTSTEPVPRQVACGVWRLGAAAALALALLPLRIARAEPETAPTSSVSAQELKAAIAEIRRRLEEQRQAAGRPAPSDAAEELRGAGSRLESLIQTMSELRAERDALRGQLLQVRDELGRAQAQIAAAEKEHGVALAGADARIANLQSELAAARQRADEAAKAQADAVAANEQARQGVAERQTQLAAAQREVAHLQSLVTAKETAQRTLAQEAERLRLRSGELEGEFDRVKAAARQGQAETEKRLASEVASLEDQLKAVESEAGELRNVAATSIEEARSLSEQLLAALAERNKLIAASIEVIDSKALQELQFAAGAASELAGTGEPALSGAPEDWRRTVLRADIFTAPASDQLTDRAAAPLAEVAELMRGSTGTVRIIGHVDASGRAATNHQLSIRRAQAVRDYLVATHGLDPARFRVEGKGSDEPIASNDTPSGRRVNRRVELIPMQ